MKFSTIATLGGLLSVGLADHTQQVVCIDPKPSTVTVTVTAGGSGGYQNPGQVTSPPQAPPYVVTAGPTVTSVDYNGDKTSVWVYPTGDASRQCTVAVYEKEVVTVIIINIDITVINGQTTTVTSTVTNAPPPTYTPTLPPLPPTTSSGAPPTQTGMIHPVIVGADGKLIYKDNTVIAKIGDIIRFDFNSTNHTVTQSSFQEPCKPLANGFNTGFNQFNNQSKTGIIFRDFEVKVSTPLWFYCAQVNHCTKGMVLGVNPGNKFPEFLSRATATATSSMPHGTGHVSRTSVVSKPTGTGSVHATSAVSTPPAKTSSAGTYNYKYAALKRRQFAA